MELLSEEKSRIYKLSCFAYKAFIVLWCVCEIAKVGKLLAAPNFFFVIQGNSIAFMDFLAFYKCGKIVCSNPHALYDLSTQMVWFNKLIAPAVTNVQTFSPYTPVFCLVMGGLSVFPIVAAYLIWMVTTVSLAFFALWRLLAVLGYLTRTERVLFLLAVFSSMPNWMNITSGQSSMLLLAMAALFISSFLTKRDLLAGFYLSIVAIKPQYALFLILPALAGKRYKIIGSAIFCVVFQCVLAGFILGWQTLLNYPKAILFDEEQIVEKGQVCGLATMTCLRGVLALFTDPSWNFKVCSLLMVAALCFLFVLWRRINPRSLQSVYGVFSLSVLLALVFNPHVYIYDWLLLAIPAALSLRTLNPLVITRYSNGSERLMFYSLVAYPILSIMGFITFDRSDRVMCLEFDTVHCLILGLMFCNFEFPALCKTLCLDFVQYCKFFKPRFASFAVASLTLLIATVKLSVLFTFISESTRILGI